MADDENDDDKKLTEKINKIVHKVWDERVKRDAPKRKKELEDGLKSFMPSLVTSLKDALKAKPEGDGDGDGDGDGEGDPDGDGDGDGDGEGAPPKPTGKKKPAPGSARMSPTDRARMQKAEKDAADAKKLTLAAQAEAKAEKAKAQKQEERTRLVTSLGGRVKPTLLDMTVDQLHSKHITRDAETGEMLWKDEKGDLLPFDDGVEAWSKTEAAKELAPPIDVRGGGGRNPGRGAGTGTGGKLTYADVGDRLGGGGQPR